MNILKVDKKKTKLNVKVASLSFVFHFKCQMHLIWDGLKVEPVFKFKDENGDFSLKKIHLHYNFYFLLK